MFFSQRVEYALRAAVWLGGNEGEPRRTVDIAKGTKVPASYLSKVLQSLSRAGLVVGTRGLHGGFVLARPASSVTVLEVVDAVEPIKRIHECPLGIEEHGMNLCPLHHKLDEAIAGVERVFAGTTLADLVVGGSDPLCPAASLVRD
ncbi:MAG TPA: Rrf2 family transcriptional regulator [Polyangiaceae bacterium]|nr:Rrf2 family transcriptional regulator [Polyangiaceae bacterium]